jgi:hypothetical protein
VKETLNTRKQVTLRLPQETITRVAKIARLAGVSPTQVYNVFLAAYCAEVLEKVGRNKCPPAT